MNKMEHCSWVAVAKPHFSLYGIQRTVGARSNSMNRASLPLHGVNVRPVRPNPSFKPTRYGRQRKPGLRHLVHHLSPGLRCLPPRAA
jgi:hypothetical protein